MSQDSCFNTLRDEMHEELTGSILPYWLNNVRDEKQGGFIGRIDGSGNKDFDAAKSSILNTRLLWTFSAAFRVLQNPEYLAAANEMYEFIERHFWDQEYGGIYWSLHADGTVKDSRKHAYSQSFAIYAYAEYYRASGNIRALTRAIDIFDLLEQYSFSAASIAWYEAMARNWEQLTDQRLSDKDIDADRSTNTHIHLLESFTTLHRVTDDLIVRERISELLDLLSEKIYESGKGRFHAFFDKLWQPVSDIYSYGHDIETVWLMIDAAKTIKDQKHVERVTSILRDVADSIETEGIDKIHGGLFLNGRNGTPLDTDKHWWPQAEAIVGFLYAWNELGDDKYLHNACKLWRFVKSKIIDSDGEWYFRVDRKGNPYREEDRVGFWKCPYHNTRACLELIDMYSMRKSN